MSLFKIYTHDERPNEKRAMGDSLRKIDTLLEIFNSRITPPELSSMDFTARTCPLCACYMHTVFYAENNKTRIENPQANRCPLNPTDKHSCGGNCHRFAYDIAEFYKDLSSCASLAQYRRLTHAAVFWNKAINKLNTLREIIKIRLIRLSLESQG